MVSFSSDPENLTPTNPFKSWGFTWLYIWSSSMCLLVESLDECQASRNSLEYLVLACSTMWTVSWFKVPPYWSSWTDMSSCGNIVSVHSCSKLYSRLTDVPFVALLTCDLVDGIFSAVRFEFFFRIWNEYSHRFSGFVGDWDASRFQLF